MPIGDIDSDSDAAITWVIVIRLACVPSDMSLEDAETTVNDSYAVTIPARIREEIDVEPGDRLRWSTDDDGRLVATIVRERYGIAADLEPIDVGEETDAVTDTEHYAYEGH